MLDKYKLSRFLNVQDACYECVLQELKAGKKQSHWIWYIFPQIDGLGRSITARKFAIQSLQEAAAYIKHPILGTRLIECTNLVLQVNASSAKDIFGFPDYLKFHSSMTLFACTNENTEIFNSALAKFYGGELDKNTLNILGLTEDCIYP